MRVDAALLVAGLAVAAVELAVEQRTIIPGVEPPYVIAQVTPEECNTDGGVRLVCTLLTDHPADLKIGIRVRLQAAAPPGADTALA